MRFARKKRVRRVQRDVQKTHPLQIHFQNRHVRAQPRGHARRVDAAGAAAQHDHSPRQHARHAAQQHAAAAIVFGQKIAAHQHRHAPGDLAHRLQQRQPAVHFDRFVGDARHAGFHQRLRQRPVGRQVQVSEQNLARRAAAHIPIPAAP